VRGQAGPGAGVAAAGEQGGRGGVADHERQPLARVLRIERQVGAAGLERGERRHHRRGRALEGQRQRGVDADAGLDQAHGQRVGALVELAVGHRAAIPRQRETLGVGGGLLAEEAMHGRVGPIAHGLTSSMRATTACTISIGTTDALSAASEFQAGLPG
jgi:hypothetical protein